jgi:hypothetical protein
MGNTLEIIDSRIGSYPVECIKKFISLGLRCCRDESDLRPSMSEVVRELDVIWRMMPDAYLRITADSSNVDPVKMISSTVSTSSASSATGNTFLSSYDLSTENT